MPRGQYDAIVVGAGHNGLVTAGYLAKAGLRTLVLERRSRAGGRRDRGGRPGRPCARGADGVGGLRAAVVRELGLDLTRPQHDRAGRSGVRAVRRRGGPHVVARPGENRDGAPTARAAARRRRVRRLRPQGPLARRVRRPPAGSRAAGPGVALARGRGHRPHADERAAKPGPGAGSRDAAGAADVGRGPRERGGRRRSAARRPRREGDSLLGHGASLGGYGAELPLGLGRRRGCGRAHGLRTGRPGSIGRRAVLRRAKPRRRATGGRRRLAHPHVARSRRGSRPRQRRGDRRPCRRLQRRPQANAPASPRRDRGRPHAGLAGRAHPRARRGGEGDPRPRPSAGDRRRRRRASARADRLRAEPRRASSAPSTTRSTAGSRRSPYLEATIPTLSDPSLAPEGTHVLSALFQYAPHDLRGRGRGTSRRAIG